MLTPAKNKLAQHGWSHARQLKLGNHPSIAPAEVEPGHRVRCIRVPNGGSRSVSYHRSGEHASWLTGSTDVL